MVKIYIKNRFALLNFIDGELEGLWIETSNVIKEEWRKTMLDVKRKEKLK